MTNEEADEVYWLNYSCERVGHLYHRVTALPTTEGIVSVGVLDMKVYLEVGGFPEKLGTLNRATRALLERLLRRLDERDL